ncbi:MAG: Fe-S protein assembly co-chaperone HscB [Myxococcota bacterium]
MPCWSCERPEGDGAFCAKCGVILPPRGGRTHFDVIGIVEGYHLDADALEAGYKQLARKLHPDRFARADARARRFSLEHATALNEAYRTLRDPVRRAEYLLRVRGRIELDIDKTGAEGAAPKVDQAFLVEMMELQEALGEARREGRAEEVEKIAADIRRRREEELHAVGEEFASPGDGAYQRIGRRLAHVRYFNRVLVDVTGREEAA